MSPGTAAQAFLEILPDDVVLMHPSGGSFGDLEETAELMRKQAEKGRYFLIVDFTGITGGLDSNAREQSTKLFKPEWMRGCVYINASMPIRVALKVVSLSLLLGGKADFPTEFVKSRAEADAAIARMRAAGG